MAYVYFNTGSPTGSGSWGTCNYWFCCPGGLQSKGSLPSVTDCVVLESNVCDLGTSNRCIASICSTGKNINVNKVLTLCGCTGGLPSCMTNGSIVGLQSCIVMTPNASLTVQNGTISGAGRIVTAGGTLNVCDSTIATGCVCNGAAGTVQFFNSTNNGTLINASNSSSKIYINNSVNCGTICGGTTNANNVIVFSNSTNCGNICLGSSTSPGGVIFGCMPDDCSINCGSGSIGCFIFCGLSVNCGGVISSGNSLSYLFYNSSINCSCVGYLKSICFFDNSTNEGCLCAGTNCAWFTGNAINCGFITASRACFLDNAENQCSVSTTCNFFISTSINSGSACAVTVNLFCDSATNFEVISAGTISSSGNYFKICSAVAK